MFNVPGNDPEWLTLTEVARRAGCDRATARYQIETKHALEPTIISGRPMFRADAVDAWVATYRPQETGRRVSMGPAREEAAKQTRRGREQQRVWALLAEGKGPREIVIATGITAERVAELWRLYQLAEAGFSALERDAKEREAAAEAARTVAEQKKASRRAEYYAHQREMALLRASPHHHQGREPSPTPPTSRSLSSRGSLGPRNGASPHPTQSEGAPREAAPPHPSVEASPLEDE